MTDSFAQRVTEASREPRVLLLALRYDRLFDDDRVYPPLGILSLAAYLRSQGVACDYDDDFDFEHPERYRGYTHFGVSVMTPQGTDAARLARFLARTFPAAVRIIGGPHATFYAHALEGEPWDFIVREDGERALLEIVRGLHVDPSARLLCYKSDVVGGELTRTRVAAPEMNGYPPPLREAWFLDRYRYTLTDRRGQAVRSTTMLTGKGCPMGCRFCEDANTGVRRYSRDNTRAQLQDIATLGYGGVYLFDDLFAIAEGVMRPYCETLAEFGLVYRCNGHANTLTDSMAALLARTGCVELAFGAESGSQRILDGVGKGTTVAQNFRFIEMAARHGIRVKAFMMIGLPGETWETIEESVRFYEFLHAHECPVQLAIFYPYAGTPFHRQYQQALRVAGERGVVPGSDAWYDLFDLYIESDGCGAYNTRGARSHATVRTRALSAETLEKVRDELFARYANPKYVSDTSFFDRHLTETVAEPRLAIYE